MLDVAARAIKPGVTTDEIDRIVHEATIAAGINHFRSVTAVVKHVLVVF